MERRELERLLLGARGLALFGGALGAPAGRAFLEVLGHAASGRGPELAAAFGRLWRELAAEEELLLPDAWQSRLVRGLLDDENPFSLAAERGAVPPALLEQARRELAVLRGLFELDARRLLAVVEGRVPELRGLWGAWYYPGGADGSSPRREVARKLAAAPDWRPCAELLAGHFSRHGAGSAGRHRAFRWEGGALRSVAHPDPVRLRELIGYEREREPLVRNTERFLEGLPAHHALLYGLPGTGKSSTVKALLNEYADAGLRLVEVRKEDLAELPRVLGALRGRGMRFVLFVDDLSFEEGEVQYKELKALLEGSVEASPENVRVYATSNRRNIVRESFAEREDDVHARDTAQEKLSLAARFGLRLTFPPPDQRLYLEIVRGLARERGLEVPEERLVERALLWDRWQAGRSGRTARQFVDELAAELGRG
ncbi:ATP-binding protein [Rubrobacter xylanophilus]|uniref:ATP-binding protein n=1 Tax=Rubrobacter xylanophilus TaxID=49319 RepID=UPI00003A2182|nr:ATP-binding protein [Rubrobacter xylanophilus]